jgi:hypothetical protein
MGSESGVHYHRKNDQHQPFPSLCPNDIAASGIMKTMKRKYVIHIIVLLKSHKKNQIKIQWKEVGVRCCEINRDRAHE